MKKIISIFLLNTILCYSQQANSLSVHDTRSTNESPSFYGKEVKAEFKDRNAVGVPGEGLFSGMLTIAPWLEYSGDKVHQLNFNNGGILYRNGLQTSQWGGWSKLLLQDANGRIGIDGISTFEKLLINGSHTTSSIQMHSDNGGLPHAYQL